jgi:DNA polymerase-3 subunit delta
MAKKECTYEEIVRNIKKRNFKPVYFLMGEEPYFIDKISDLLNDTVLTDEEKDFNLITLYGDDTTPEQIINAARRYPMMAEYQLVIVREAQLLDKIDNLVAYLKSPSLTTILVLCYKYKKLDRRKTLASLIDKVGVLYESPKIQDYKVAGYISSIFQGEGICIDDKSVQIFADYLGSDLSKINQEVNKLKVLLPSSGVKRVTPEMIERNIGISKDYNNFELINAIVRKDKLKANRIVQYFERNQKKNPVQATLGALFNYFSNLLIAYYAKDKSEAGLMRELGLKGTFQAKEYIAGMRAISAMKAFNMIGEIRRADARSKGYENNSADGGEILRELVYKMMH